MITLLFVFISLLLFSSIIAFVYFFILKAPDEELIETLSQVPTPVPVPMTCPAGFELNSLENCECKEYSDSVDCFKVDITGTTYNNYILKLKWNIINQPLTTISSVRAILFYDNDTKNLTINLPSTRTGDQELIISDLTLMTDVVFSLKLSVNGIVRLNVNPFYFSFVRETQVDPYNSTNISLRNGGNTIRTSLSVLFTRFSLFSPDGTKKASHRVSCNQCPRGDKFIFSMDSTPAGFSLSPLQESLEITIPFRNGDYLEFTFGNIRKIAKIVDGITVDSSEFWVNFIDDNGNDRQDMSDLQIINTLDISWANSDQLVLSAPFVSPVADMIGDWVQITDNREIAKIRIKQNPSDITKIDVEYSTIQFHPPIYSLVTWTASPDGNFYKGKIGNSPEVEKIQKVSQRTITYQRNFDLNPMYFFKAPSQNLPNFFTAWS